MSEVVSKSWFCVFDNPHEHGYLGTPEEVIDKLKSEWVDDYPTRTGAWSYCVSSKGLIHIHMVLEDVKSMRFSYIRKNYACGMHIEATKGTKNQALDYINKKGKYAEKGEQIIYIDHHGSIKGAQGKRNDLDIIYKLIAQGKNPEEIMSMSIHYRIHEILIKKEFFAKRSRETPPRRNVNVIWHTGEARSGKSNTYVELCEKHGEAEIYLMNDYTKGGLDLYCGEPILVMDELKESLPFQILLNYLEGYKIQIPSRYANGKALWTEVHITSIYPPEEIYEMMVPLNRRSRDCSLQLIGRINHIFYHYKENGEYKKFGMPMSEYTNYNNLKNKVEEIKQIGNKNNGFEEVYYQVEIPF